MATTQQLSTLPTKVRQVVDTLHHRGYRVEVQRHENDGTFDYVEYSIMADYRQAANGLLDDHGVASINYYRTAAGQWNSGSFVYGFSWSSLGQGRDTKSPQQWLRNMDHYFTFDNLLGNDITIIDRQS